MTQKSWQSASLYHLGKRAKLKTIQKYLARQNVFEDCLDIGTGTGAVAREIKKYGTKWSYLDNDEQSLSEAQKILAQGSFFSDFKQLGERRFDLITIIDTFFYFNNPTDMLKKIVTSLKPEGRIIITLTDGDSDRLLNKFREKLNLGLTTRGYIFEESPKKFVHRLELQRLAIEYYQEFSYFIEELMLIFIDIIQKTATNNIRYGSDLSILINRNKIHPIKLILVQISYPIFYVLSFLDLPLRKLIKGHRYIIVVKKI